MNDPRITGALIGAAAGTVLGYLIPPQVLPLPNGDTLKIPGAAPGALGGSPIEFEVAPHRCNGGVPTLIHTGLFGTKEAGFLLFGATYVCTTPEAKAEFERATARVETLQSLSLLAFIAGGAIVGHMLGGQLAQRTRGAPRRARGARVG